MNVRTAMRMNLPGMLRTGLVILVTLFTGCSPAAGTPERVINDNGLAATECWFSDTGDMPSHRCYYMTVDETPGVHNERTVSFPVVVFPGGGTTDAQNPLLHLGGGGPGASLALDSEYNVLSIYEQMRPLSVSQGRDLVLIDPRGAGQSTPVMMCQAFVDNVIPRWRQNLTIRDSYEQGHQDFDNCLKDLIKSDMDFSAYSSTTVVSDLEQLREAMGVTQWILYGASYASVYAQLYARDYPLRLQAMILDSATFLDTPRHEVLVRELTEPYKRLFNHCQAAPACDGQPAATEKRFWDLVDQLDRQPLRMTVSSPLDDTELDIILTGWRFLDSMLWGVYEESIFGDFPQILGDLERGRPHTTRGYVEDLLVYLTDKTFGDISASSHYCIDRKPYIEEVKVKQQIRKIPYEYARNIALLGLEYADYCDRMSIASKATGLNKPIRTEVPTLFIHGELDTVTLLDHVSERRENFANSHVATSSQAHIVLDDPCIQKAAARFVKDGFEQTLTSRCELE